MPIPSRLMPSLGAAVFRTLMLCVAFTVFTVGSVTATEISQPVLYEGYALDVKGQPLSGTHRLHLRYLDDTSTVLLAETFDEVAIDGGRFEIQLGAGRLGKQSSYDSLATVFAEYPELSFEVTIGLVRQAPLVGVLPAGHSLQSRLVAAGTRTKGDDDGQHWKHYKSTNGTTALQTGTLSPTGAAGQLPSSETLRRRPFTLPMSGPGLSVEVRDLPRAAQQPMPKDAKEINPPRHEQLFDQNGNRFGTIAPRQDDKLAGIPGNATRTPSLNFQFPGVGNVSGVLPPDTEGTVGPNHYVHVVNSAFAVYDKSGNLLTGPANTNTLWSGFGGACQTDNSGDAIFAYDEQADRFVLTQFAVAGSHQSVCFAISQTPDPTGAYYLYEVMTPRFPDYYKVGVWPDPDNNAYFFGTNSGSQSQYDVFAVDRANMLIGAAARPMQFFQSFVNLMMPADVDGPTGPPLGSPGIFYTFRDGGEPYFGSPPSDSIDVWEFDVDWNSPGNTTFTLVDSLAPAPFNWTVCGFFVSNCIPQPGTSQGIDSASWWPMQRLVYRNFGSHQTLIGSWTVDVLSSGNRAAPRWFELRNSGAGWSVFQEGTHSPDAIHRWMPSVAMDGSGNIAMGYSRGDGSNFPSIYYATRNASDPAGTMGTEELMFAGSGSQTHSAARWGDYSSMELDPADDCTFWYTTEYMATTSSAGWLTRVGNFTIPGCGGPPVPDFSVSCSPASFNIDQGGSDSSTCTVTSSNGFADSVNLACASTGGINCSFAPIQVTPPVNGSASSTLTLSVPGGQATGSYNFNVEGTSGATTKTSGLSVEVVPAGSNGPQDAVYNASLGAPECAIAGSSCDSLTLVDGRANLGPEPNQPNTLDNCSDGGSGSYHNDESNDAIVISTLDGGNLSEGDTVQIDATVYAWSNGAEDTLDLYYAADASNPNWVYITSIGTPAGGLQTLSAQYTLPAGDQQAVRAQFRYQSSQTACSAGNYNDRDDLVFAVESATANTPPAVTIGAPADGGSATEGSSVSFSASAIDTEDGDISASLGWTSSIDGSIGSGASFSTSTLAAGVHTITAAATDSGSLSGSDAITFTINVIVNEAPVVSITAPANGSSSTSGDSVSFTGTANDAEDGGDVSAGLSWSSSLDGSIGSGASFATTTLSVGTHTITASVTDTGGLTGSDAISFTVNAAPNTPPTVAITSPASGSSSTSGDSVTFTGTASDTEDGDISAGLSWSSSLDGSIGSGASFATTTLSVGTHTITASVTDTGGLSDSDAISFTVNALPNTPPTVTITAPASGSNSTAGDSVTFIGTANDTEDGGDISAGLSWSSSLDGSIGSGASFATTTLSVGTHTITASVTDTGGLSGSDAISFVVNSSPDTPPTVTITAPADGHTVTAGTAINFTGTAADTEDGDISASLAWVSSIDGSIGSGGSVTTSALSNGTHTISASVTDSGGLSDSDSITVTVNPPTGGDTVIWMSFRSNTDVPGLSTVVRDDDIVSYNLTTGVWALEFDGSDVGLASLEISGLAVLPDGDLLLSFTAAATIDGISVDDSDVVRFTPTSMGANTAGTFSLYFDGSDVGMSTNGEDIDSLALSDGSLVISSLGAINANGISGGRDEDLFLFTGTTGSATSGSFSQLFDGSDVGLSNSNNEEIDAAAFVSGGNLLFSTVGDFSASGLTGPDEDIVEFSGTYGTATSGSLSLLLDLSALGVSEGEDIGSLHVIN